MIIFEKKWRFKTGKTSVVEELVATTLVCIPMFVSKHCVCVVLTQQTTKTVESRSNKIPDLQSQLRNDVKQITCCTWFLPFMSNLFA